MNENMIPSIDKVMQRDVPAIAPEATIEQLTQFLVRHRMPAVPVVIDPLKNRRLIGFVSEGDALRRLANDTFEEPHAEPATVQSIMKRHPLAVQPELDLFAVASIFISHGYRTLPVVDDAYQLLGLVSRRDVLVELNQLDSTAVRAFVQEHYPPDLHSLENLRFVASVL